MCKVALINIRGLLTCRKFQYGIDKGVVLTKQTNETAYIHIYDTINVERIVYCMKKCWESIKHD
jgi:hypothetical protein